MKIKTIDELVNAIEKTPARSAWSRGVRDFAVDLVCDLKDSFSDDEVEELFEEPKILHKVLLNGANDWNHYSWSGCFLAYDCDIARSLCTPSELKKTKNGALRPNKEEEWLDVQARALYQAERLIMETLGF